MRAREVNESKISESTDKDGLQGFHQSLKNAVRGKMNQMQADVAIMKAQDPTTWQWKVGDQVYSPQTGKTYTITYTNVRYIKDPKTKQKVPEAIYGYQRGEEGQDNYERGTLIADRAHKSLTKLTPNSDVVEATVDAKIDHITDPEQGVAENQLNEISSTIAKSRTQPGNKVNYSSDQQANAQAVIRLAHERLQLPHDLEWQPLSTVMVQQQSMNIFQTANLQKLWQALRGYGSYSHSEMTKDRAVEKIAFLIRGPTGTVVLVVYPENFNMIAGAGTIRSIPSKFAGSATYIDPNDGSIEYLENINRTSLLPTIKAATGKVNPTTGEILVAPVYRKHNVKIIKRKQQQAKPEDTVNIRMVYHKIYRLLPRVLQQVEADIMGMVQSLIKNKAYEKARKKIDNLKAIKDLEGLMSTGEIIDHHYLTKATNLALYLTASHLFPDLTGEIQNRYGNHYESENDKGPEQVMRLIVNNDRKVLSIYLGFFKRSLLLLY